MSKIVEIDVLRKKKESKARLEVQTDFKTLYGIELDENQLVTKLRNDKRKEKGLEWD